MLVALALVGGGLVALLVYETCHLAAKEGCMAKVDHRVPGHGRREQLNRIEQALARIEARLGAITQAVGRMPTKEDFMAIHADIQAELDALNVTVAADTDATNSVVQVLTFNTQKLDELLASSTDPAEVVAAIKAANEAFKANTQAAADAAVANTRS
jgi:hypothetical protein